MARPIKYTKALAEEIAQEIRQGVTPEVACQVHGLGISTYYEWCAKGRDGVKPFTEFLEVITHARVMLRRLVERRILLSDAKFFASRSPLMREKDGIDGWHGFEKNDVNVQVVTVSSIVDSVLEEDDDFDILSKPQTTHKIKYIGENGTKQKAKTEDK